ncbi:MAG: nucleotidyltransferase domain-containing protein [Bacteroidota bacterium]
MSKLTIDWIKDNGLLVLEVITGSKAYGLDTAKSDTDIRGVFVLPKDMYYGLEYTEQVNNETNDIVYYELKRFMELLARNNPNILEMLNTPEHCVLQKHPVMGSLKPEMFLSKLCQQTFANYAYTQIKKAYGLEKKIVNPVDELRKSVLDFCFVYEGGEAIQAGKYLEANKFEQQRAGLTAISHLRDCYNLFYSGTIVYSGIRRKDESNDVCLSSVPKGEKAIAMLYFNKDGYSIYCKRYKEYWEWVTKRNDERYKTTMSHGKNYDSKNMMHVFRLLSMAKEIALEGKINVFRNDRDFLFSIKEGKFEYDELLGRAELLKDELVSLYQHSDLPDVPDIETINSILIEMRKNYYQERS